MCPIRSEVGRLANTTEDRTHFSAWAISSAPLILGFDAADTATVERVWPIITNAEVLRVSQTWAGSAGRCVTATADYQVWTKPLGGAAHALLVFSNASVPVDVHVRLTDIDPSLNGSVPVRVRCLYRHRALPPVTGGGGVWTVAGLMPHDSRLVTLTPRATAPPPSCDLLAACVAPSTCAALASRPPEIFDVRFETTAGDFTVRTTTAWAPPFAKRFWQLARVGYMRGAPFYRVDRRSARDAWVVQFGYRGEPAVDQCWDARQARNDTWRVHAPGNVRGTVAFSMGAVPANVNCSAPAGSYCAQGFSTNLYINYANNTRLDAHGFAIFGTVLPPGMEVVDRLFAGYGEVADLCKVANGSHTRFCEGVGSACRGVSMARLIADGASYWRREKPKLDAIRSMRVLGAVEEEE